MAITYSTAAIPLTPVKYNFASVEELSPQFAELYNQAAAAEAYSLLDIAGMGYRKSLEFLIKVIEDLSHTPLAADGSPSKVSDSMAP